MSNTKDIKDYLEIWKPIPGYPFYEASNFGRVRSINKTVRHNYGGDAIRKGKVLAQHINEKGYLNTGLTISGKTKTIHVHRLIALAWHPNPENKPTVNHIDTNKQNNVPDNLEWATQKEQVQHAFKHHCRKDFSLSQETISKIVAKTQKGVVLTDIETGKSIAMSSISNCARLLQLKQPTISKAISRNSITCKKYKVSYAV